MVIKFCQDTVSKFPNFSVLLDFVEVISYLSKHWCLYIFSDEVSKGQKIATVNEGWYLNNFKQNQLVPVILFFPGEKMFEKLYVLLGIKKSPEISQDIRQWSKP